MVLKAVNRHKTTLHTGNTVKRLNRAYIKGYIHQGTLVKRVVKEEAYEHDADVVERDLNLGQEILSPDVVYSLNKKKRWVLPEKIKKAILNDKVSSPHFKVSYLKKVKLHRKNACLEYIADEDGIKRNIKPKKKFFNEMNVVRIQRLKLNPKRHFPLQPKYLVEPASKEVVPEVRYDVYLPSEKDCCLTYNPKYVGLHNDVIIDQEDGKYPSNGLSSKGARTRKRLSNKDENSCYSFVDNDALDMDGLCDETPNDLISEQYIPKGIIGTPIQCNLSDLIDLTVQCRKKCIKPKRNQAQRSAFAKQKYGKNSILKYDHEMEQRTGEHLSNMTDSSPPEIDLCTGPEMIPVTVQMERRTTVPAYLSCAFGEKYQEASVWPRKFSLNIKDDVLNTFEVSRKGSDRTESHLTLELQSYLIFEGVDQFDEVNGHQQYRISLNAHLDLESLALENLDDDICYDVHQVVGAAVEYLKILPRECFRKKVDNISSLKKPAKSDIIQKTLDWNILTLDPEDAFAMVSTSSTSREESLSEAHRDDLNGRGRDQLQVCDICFEQIGHVGCFGRSGTALKQCQHWFCNDCWRHHIILKIKQGDISILCPAQGCDAHVDDTTILTFANLGLFMPFHRRRRNTTLQSKNWKWCPNAQCGRSVKLHEKGVDGEPVIVSCDCGKVYCELCHEDPHWPASCDVSYRYHKKLLDNKLTEINLFDDPVEVQDVTVKTKQCPQCSNMIEKKIGCDHVICICKTAFCWKCGEKFDVGQYGHRNPCQVKELESVHLKHTRSKYEQGRNLKLSPLEQMAVEHRQSKTTTRMKCKADLLKFLKRLPLDNAALNMQQICTERVIHVDAVNQGVRRAECIASELHHLIEYSAIRLDRAKKSATKHKVCMELLGRLSFISKRIDALMGGEALCMKPAEVMDKLHHYVGLAESLGSRLVHLVSWKSSSSLETGLAKSCDR